VARTSGSSFSKSKGLVESDSDFWMVFLVGQSLARALKDVGLARTTVKSCSTTLVSSRELIPAFAKTDETPKNEVMKLKMKNKNETRIPCSTKGPFCFCPKSWYPDFAYCHR
jgi:hypothetical protein